MPPSSCRTVSPASCSEPLITSLRCLPHPVIRTVPRTASGCPLRHLQRVCGLPLLQTHGMAWVSIAAPVIEHADCLCSRPFKSCQVPPVLLVPLCERSSIHCPVTMSSSEVKSYGHNLAIGIRLALLSCFASPTRLLMVLCQSFYLRKYMNLVPVTIYYDLLILSLSSQCRWPLDVPSSPLRRYPAPQVNALYATASITAAIQVNAAICSYYSKTAMPTPLHPQALLFCCAILNPDPDPDPEVCCLLSYCLLDYFCCCC
jgi:hypothetical protein